MTSVGPRITKKNFSVSMFNPRSSKENKTKDGAEGKQTEPAIEIDLETPEEDTTGNTPETVKEESQVKRTSFTQRIAMMVGIKSRDIVTGEPKAEKGKTFGTVSTITTESNQDDDQVKQGAAANNMAKVDHETTTPLELGDLMAKLDQIHKKLKHREEEREFIKKELRYNKHEYLDNYFNLARATEEKLQQMSDKVEATNGERDKNIKKDMQEMK